MNLKLKEEKEVIKIQAVLTVFTIIVIAINKVMANDYCLK
jgi:hypothetical protein